jgi:hypothetical protein
VVLAQRLPALLELILAQCLRVGAASGYAVTTLTGYAIFAIGTLLALNTIGARWSYSSGWWWRRACISASVQNQFHKNLDPRWPGLAPQAGVQGATEPQT